MKNSRQKPITYSIDDKGCHICTSHSLLKKGYPKCKRNNKWWSIHRLMYTEQKGDIPEGLLVRHTCDNTRCINPDHLILGTYLDNNRDRVVRNRNRDQRGMNHNLTTLTDDDVRNIKQSSDKKLRELAEIYNVSETTICSIRKGAVWAHIN